MKNNVKKSLSIALLFTVLGSFFNASASTVPDEQIRLDLGNSSNQNRIPGDPRVGAIFSDTKKFFSQNFPVILGIKKVSAGTIFSATNPYAIECTSVQDPACSQFPGRYISAKYPYCSEKGSVICIKSFWAVLPDGQRVEARFVRELDPGTPVRFLDEPRYGIPRTSGDSLFEFVDQTGKPVLTHAGGTLFALRTSLIGTFGSGAYDFEGSIFAVSIKQTANEKVNFRGYTSTAIGAGYSQSWDSPVTNDCVVVGVNTCGVPFPLPLDVRFGVQMQSTVFPIKWLHGRLDDPIISAVYNTKVYQMTLEAKPIKSPVLSGITRFSQLTPKLQNRYSSIVEDDKKDPKGRILIDDLTPARGDYSLSALKDWLEYLPDRAQALPTAWSIRTISVSDLATSKFPTKCLSLDENIAGLVTTNATAYSSGPPKFDSTSGSLEYQVAAPHFEKDGVTPFKGSYDLAIRSDVARCIYGFTNAPIQATVSVVSSDSDPKIVTTTFKEANGWVNFSARNFEFSAPTIVVKMTQQAPAVAPTLAPKKAIPSTRATPSPRAKVCFNAKGAKKSVAAASPCPKGYKAR